MNKERIFKMLQSDDKELITLGVKLAFEQGEEWCEQNIPCFGRGMSQEVVERTALKRENIYEPLYFRRGRISAMIGLRGIVDFRYTGDFVNLYQFQEI